MEAVDRKRNWIRFTNRLDSDSTFQYLTTIIHIAAVAYTSHNLRSFSSVSYANCTPGFHERAVLPLYSESYSYI